MITPKLLMAMGIDKPRAEVFAPLLEAGRTVPGDAFNTITSKKGIAMLVSQFAHETDMFTALEENLNYSQMALMTGQRAKYFTAEQAKRYGRIEDGRGNVIQRANQPMIANLYYGGRMGNRGVTTMDGWNFRGSGVPHLTGRYNFNKFAKTIGKTADDIIDWVRQPDGGVAAGYWFWRENKMVLPASYGDVTTCTEILNGGTNGLNNRIRLYKLALAGLG